MKRTIFYKKCSKCKQPKEISQFGNPANKTISTYCKVCQKKINKEKKIINREKLLKTNYNMSLKQYNEIFVKQNGCCAICKKHQSELSITLAVDHNHETGKIRGLLCQNCNRALGHFQDNINTMQNAILYIKKYNNT